jgi:hypothetical protein
MHELPRPLPFLYGENAVILEDTRKSIREFYDTIQKWCDLRSTKGSEYEDAFQKILKIKKCLDEKLNCCRKNNLLREEERRVIESIEKCAKVACSIHRIETDEYVDEDRDTVKSWGDMFFSKKLSPLWERKLSISDSDARSESTLSRDSLGNASFMPAKQGLRSSVSAHKKGVIASVRLKKR